MTPDDLHDLFGAVGGLGVRKLFGGLGLYRDGRIFGVVLRGAVYMKGDAVAAPVYEAAGCEQWRYPKDGGFVAMPYWRVPDDALEDPEIALRWARVGLEAAARSAPAKGASPRRTRKAKAAAGA